MVRRRGSRTDLGSLGIRPKRLYMVSLGLLGPYHGNCHSPGEPNRTSVVVVAVVAGAAVDGCGCSGHIAGVGEDRAQSFVGDWRTARHRIGRWG